MTREVLVCFLRADIGSALLSSRKEANIFGNRGRKEGSSSFLPRPFFIIFCLYMIIRTATHHDTDFIFIFRSGNEKGGGFILFVVDLTRVASQPWTTNIAAATDDLREQVITCPLPSNDWNGWELNLNEFSSEFSREFISWLPPEKSSRQPKLDSKQKKLNHHLSIIFHERNEREKHVQHKTVPTDIRRTAVK